MTRFGRRNEIFARAQKSVTLDAELKEIIGKNLRDGEKFDDAANRFIAFGIVCEENHSPEIKAHRDTRIRSRLNLDEYLIMAIREGQQHHESYSDTLNRYAWLGISCEAKHYEKSYKPTVNST